MCKKKLVEVRVYCECYEQGLYIASYIKQNHNISELPLNIVYTKPKKFSTHKSSSNIAKLFCKKDFDAAICIIDSNRQEEVLTTIEFSTAVPTDDHILQRFDVVYWSSFYRTPCIKISPTKMHNTDFGGGSKIKLEHEYNAALNMGGVYYHIEWPLLPNSDFVATDQNYLSCPPFSNDLSIILNRFVDDFCRHANQDYYDYEHEQYRKYVGANYPNATLDVSDSTRYSFSDNRMTLKFNRFGHAMDPERGALYFWGNHLADRPIIKIEIQRSSREKYKSLFDGANSDQIMRVIDNDVLGNGNKIDPGMAFRLFLMATNTRSLFSSARTDKNIVFIDNKALLSFLTNGSNTINTLLHFGEKIILTGVDGSVILEIRWDTRVVDSYYNKLSTDAKNTKTALPIVAMSNNELNEDVVTYLSAELMKKCGLTLIAASYPGAQGDRAILSGSGRRVKRDYIDLIGARRSDDGVVILLQENKVEIDDTLPSDIYKLLSVKNDPEKRDGLLSLVAVSLPLSFDNSKYHYYLGLGGKGPLTSRSNTDFDYLLYVSINNSGGIDWRVLSSSKDVFSIFSHLTHEKGNLFGTLPLKYPIKIVS